MGHIYKRGTVYWIKYYVNGRPRRESSGSPKESAARSLLKEREGRAVTGQPILKRADRVYYEEIAEDLLRHYATTGSRDLQEARSRLKPLARFFTRRRAVDIDRALVTQYVEHRQEEGLANGTINREVSTLVTMLGLAVQQNKLLRMPRIRKLAEAPPRSGFFEPAQFAAVGRHLPPHLQVAATIAYTFGWRLRSEVLPLRVSQVDLEAGTLRLEPGSTKNGEGREVYLTPELTRLLHEPFARVKALGRRLNRVVPFLFPHGAGRRVGLAIKECQKSWTTACRRVGLVGMLRHDMRRSAVRNMVNDGVPERVAMSITGHKTRAVFDRYHIVSPADLKAAAQKLAGTIPGAVDLPEANLSDAAPVRAR